MLPVKDVSGFTDMHYELCSFHAARPKDGSSFDLLFHMQLLRWNTLGLLQDNFTQVYSVLIRHSKTKHFMGCKYVFREANAILC